jgi:hypothetical protein
MYGRMEGGRLVDSKVGGVSSRDQQHFLEDLPPSRAARNKLNTSQQFMDWFAAHSSGALNLNLAHLFFQKRSACM